jgi:hypothetical protein
VNTRVCQKIAGGEFVCRRNDRQNGRIEFDDSENLCGGTRVEKDVMTGNDFPRRDGVLPDVCSEIFLKKDVLIFVKGVQVRTVEGILANTVGRAARISKRNCQFDELPLGQG